MAVHYHKTHRRWGIATDREGCVKFMNPMAEKMTDWSQSVAVGKPLREVFYIINEFTPWTADMGMAAPLSACFPLIDGALTEPASSKMDQFPVEKAD